MSDLTDLGVAAIRDGVRDGAFKARDVAEAFVANVAKAKALNAFLVETPDHALAAADAADAARAAGETLKPLAGVPIGMKDLFCTKGVPATAASLILEDFTPPYESTVSGQSVGGGRGDARQAQHGPVCDGIVERNQRVRQRHLAVAAERRRKRPARPRRLLRRFILGDRSAVVPGGDRHRHRRIDPPARRLHRDQRDQTDLWPLFALGRDRLFVVARSGRADGARRARLRDHAGKHGRVRRQGRDLARSAGARSGKPDCRAICAASASVFPRNIASMPCRRKSRRCGSRVSHG